MTFKHAVALAVVTAVAMVVPSNDRVVAQGQATPDQTPDQMVAALKNNLEESQKRLRQYEWIETTVISLKGEEKARTQNRVYHGTDGKLTKLPIGAPPPAAAAPSGRGGRLKQRIVENKKDDMQDYMERAANLIHLYVPPSPAQVQKAKDAGNMLLRPPQQGIVRVEFPDFIQKSDRLVIDVDAKALLLSAIHVATYLDTPEDAVTLDVRFGTLTDGTSYAAQTTLEAKAKNIRVVVDNSNYRPLAQ